MPQGPSTYQPYGIQIPEFPSTFQPYQPEPVQQQSSSWVPKAEDVFTWPNALRMGASVAGDYLGALAAPFTFGASYPVLSFLGGAAGELGGQLMEGKAPNWGLVGTEGALNLVPGPNIPGRGAALSEIGKYGLKAGGYGAAQGAIGAYPRYWAEEGTLTSPSKWEPPPFDYLAGQTVAGAGIGTAVGGGLAGGRRGLELLGQPAPANAPVTASLDPYRQPSLPGMESVRTSPDAQYYGPPPFETPVRIEPADARNRVLNQMDAQTQQQIFELTLDRAEAQRAGDISTITQIDNAILEAKMRNAEQKRNWTPPAPEPEAPAPVFPDFGEGQGSLGFGAVRGEGGRFRQPGQFEYTPITRTGAPAGGPNEWQFPPIESMAPNQGVDVVAPEVRPPSAEAQAATGAGLPDIIDMPTNQTELALRKNQGYVVIPNHLGPNRQLQMALGGKTAAPAVAAVTTAPLPGAAAARKVPGKFRMGDDIPVPNEVVDADPNYVSNMAENKYTPISNEGGVTIFRHESKRDGGTRVGSMDIGEMINLLMRGARQIADSDMAAKARGAIAELRRRMQNGETQISPEEFRRVSAGIPNIEEVAQQMGIDLPDVRARALEEPVSQEPLSSTVNQEQFIREQMIRNAQTFEVLDALQDQFGDEHDAAVSRGDTVAQERTFQLNRAVAERRRELISEPIQPPPSQRTAHTEWLARNSPEGLQQIESATDYQQLITQVNEWEAERVAANQAGDRTNGHRLYRMVMAGYDRMNEIRDAQYRPRPRSAESQAASDAIFDSRLTGAPIQGRVGEPVAAGGWQPEPSTNLPAMDPRQVSMYELADRMNAASRPSELAAIRTQIETYLDDAVQDNFIPGISYARRLLEDVNRRLGEPVQSALPLKDAPTPETHPIQLGPQPNYKGELRISAEQYDRMASSTSSIDQQTRRRDRSLARVDPNRAWDGFALSNLSDVPDGPPGLSVEGSHPHFRYRPDDYSAYYTVVYRGPNGKPVVMAKVAQNSDGTRGVRTLAADRSKGGLYGRGVYQVGMKLIEMDAAAADSSTSAYTKHLIGRVKDYVKTGIDETSRELAQTIAQLLRMKELEGVPKRIRTPEDLLALIEDMAADAGPQPELPFEPRAARRAATAAELEDVPEQMRLTEEVRTEQMPLPLQSAINSSPFGGGGRSPLAGEPTGGVAHFPSKAKNLYEITQEITKYAGRAETEGVMIRAQELIDQYKTSSQARTDYAEVNALIDRAKNADEAELFQQLADSIKEKGNELNTAEMEGFGQIRPMKELRERFVPDEPQSPTGKRWTGIVKQLDEMKAPDALYRDIIQSPNVTLKQGETWRGKVLSMMEFFEKKARESEGSGESGAIDIGAIAKAPGEIIRSFFAKGPATPEFPKGTPSKFEQFWGLSTAATTIADVSIPLRQGLPAILTPEWRASLKPMFQALWSGETAKAIDQQIRNNKVHQREFNPTTGKWDPTYAERANLKLVEGNNIGASENDISSAWIESGGNIPYASKFYRETWGRVARASNRAASTFLNHLRTGLLERLSDQAQLMAEGGAETGSVRPNIFKKNVTPEQAANLNPYYNDEAAKVLGDFINTATGRAPLKIDVLPGLELNLEFMSKAMGLTFFSPRNMFSRGRMMWPATYLQAPPFVRKQYLKSAFATVAAWSTMTYAMKMAAEGLGYDADVSMDPESADFGKVRIGKVRLDLGGGFLPFAAAITRLWTGFYRSSSTGQRHAYGEGFRPETQQSQLQRFFSNKFNPATKFGYDMARAAEYTPFHVFDRIAQMYAPLIGQDTVEMFKEDPKLIPILMPLVALGGGTQIYGRGEQVAKIVPKKYDWVVKGGGLNDIVNPMNWDIFHGR